MRIFIHRPDQTYGPYSLPEIRESLATGNVVLSDTASYEGRKERVPLSSVPGVTDKPSRPSGQINAAAKFFGGSSPDPVGAPKRDPLGCCGWIPVAFGLFFLIGFVSSWFDKGTDKKAKKVSPYASQRAVSPREFGYGLGSELLSHARSNGGITGIVFFAQSCRRENPTVKTYSDKEYSEFQSGMIAAYQDWIIRNGISE